MVQAATNALTFDDFIALYPEDGMAEYEKLGVPEYWISDYRGLGGIRFIGSPKMPTIWICGLDEKGESQEYQEGKAFREEDFLVSSNFFSVVLDRKTDH